MIRKVIVLLLFCSFLQSFGAGTTFKHSHHDEGSDSNEESHLIIVGQAFSYHDSYLGGHFHLAGFLDDDHTHEKSKSGKHHKHQHYCCHAPVCIVMSSGLEMLRMAYTSAPFVFIKQVLTDEYTSDLNRPPIALS